MFDHTELREEPKLDQGVGLFGLHVGGKPVHAHVHALTLFGWVLFDGLCCLSKASCERQCGRSKAAFTCETVQMR